MTQEDVSIVIRAAGERTVDLCKKLVLEQATTGVDWQELGSAPLGKPAEADFLPAIKALLKGPDHAA